MFTQAIALNIFLMLKCHTRGEFKNKIKNMFKKIVSNLPFSPALVGQLGFYAKRLKKEETTRRLGLIFVALALVVQSLAVFQPPESANASSQGDFVLGGIGTSINNFLAPYDANTRHLKDIMNYVGITREEIAASQYTRWIAGNKLNFGLTTYHSYEEGARQYNATDQNGQTTVTFYSAPLSYRAGAGATFRGFVGYSSRIGWFGIMSACGNLNTDIQPTAPTPTPAPTPEPPKCNLNPNILASDENCKSCSGNDSLWIKDASCIPNIVRTKKAINMSQGSVDATTVTAKPNDQISYTITAENTGLSVSTIELKDDLTDVLEYSTLVDAGGGVIDKNTNILSWPDITLKSKDKQTRTFTVRILENIPATAQGASDSNSYDCVVKNVFGNATSIKIDCPVPKIVETVTTELPKTGPSENIIFADIVFAITIYFYMRSRQVKKEIRLIRRDLNTGTI